MTEITRISQAVENPLSGEDPFQTILNDRGILGLPPRFSCAGSVFAPPVPRRSHRALPESNVPDLRGDILCYVRREGLTVVLNPTRGRTDSPITSHIAEATVL